MQMETEKKDTQELSRKEKLGEVKIADEVVAMIAGLAATEVEGVDSMAGNITNELVGKLGMKNLNRGVKISCRRRPCLGGAFTEHEIWLQHS